MKTTNTHDEPGSTEHEQVEQKGLDEMGAIRDLQHEPSHNRLAAFEQQEKEKIPINRNSPVFKPGTLYINEWEIITPQDFADAIEDAHGKYPKLYGFEVYEEELKEMHEQELDKENTGQDLER